MIDLTGIARRVKRLFGDESGVQVTDDDILDWANDCMREVVTQNHKINVQTAYAPALKGMSTVEFTTDEEMESLISVAVKPSGSNSYLPMQFLSPGSFDKLFPGWNSGFNNASDTALPGYYTVVNSGSMVVFPPPSTDDGVGYLLTYNSFYPEATNLNKGLDVSKRYYQLVLEYCMMKAYELDEDWTSVDRKMQYVQTTISQLSTTDQVGGQNSYPVTSVNGYGE